MMAAILTCSWTMADADTVRGRVIDADTGEPLAGATVTVVETAQHSVTTTEGYYTINDIPIGRYTLEARCVGYEPQQQVEVLVAGRSSSAADFQLWQKAEQLQEVTVRPVVNKARPLNPTALAGAQMISTEEAQRFAGSFEDIGRVVRRYVGNTGSTENAGISAHGNPYSSTTYRLEGVEIPAPLHFYGTGTHGAGEISALHTDLLQNGDYYSGAAPAEFGNALGGVMDLRLRPGSNDTYQHSAKVSTLGVNLTSEGPLSRKSGASSYIVSYRYGLTKLLNDMGVGIIDGDQGDYHDLNVKLNFPLGSHATLSAWALGSWDHSYVDWDEMSEEWTNLYDQADFYTRVNLCMGGLTLDASAGHGWRLKASVTGAWRDFTAEDRYAIYATDGSLLTDENHYSKPFAPSMPFARSSNQTTWLMGAVDAQRRFSARYLLKAGASLRHIDYSQTLSRAASIFTGQLLPLADGDATCEQVDAYVNNNLRLGRWTLNAGLHLAVWTLASDWTLQPRFSAEWQPADGHTLSMAYGLTTHTESMDTYFASVKDANRKLKPVRSHQFVFDYKWQPTERLKLSTEAWAEWQTAVPVSPTSTYCVLNRYLFYAAEPLTGDGRARGYGISVGAEQYMTHGLYWLINGAVYKNEYRDHNGLWHPTRMDRGWAVNAAAGKEWNVGRRGMLSVNIATTAMGGLRETPYDEPLSAALYAAGSPYVARDESRPMADRNDAVIDLSLNVSYRIHTRRIDHVIGLDYMNLLGQEEPVSPYYNYQTHRVQMVKDCYSIPNISYAIIF